MAESVDIAVVGAGLAGLACARSLQQARRQVRVFEAADTVGGRVRTDLVDGFHLDRGFQLLNTAYPELHRQADLVDLDLRFFDRALLLYDQARTWRLEDPRSHPWAALKTLRAPIGSLRDIVAMAAYAANCRYRSPSRIKEGVDQPAHEHWRRRGISDESIDHILGPFFAGVFLERELTTSSRFADLLVRAFLVGQSAVPAAGMQALPEQLSADLDISLGTTARRVTSSTVETEEGIIDARAVVVATDADTAGHLVPSLPGSSWNGVTTWYHVAPRPPLDTPTLLIDPERSPIDNTVVMTAAAPSYAPDNRALIATSLARAPRTEPPHERDVRGRLATLYRTSTTGWEPIGIYDLPHALPAMPAPHIFRRRIVQHGVFVCGDHRDTSSIQGALVSGRRTAQEVLNALTSSTRRS